MSKTSLIIFGSLMLLLGQVFAWFLNNSQFVWDWWKDKPIFTAAIWAFPVSLALPLERLHLLAFKSFGRAK